MLSNLLSADDSELLLAVWLGEVSLICGLEAFGDGRSESGLRFPGIALPIRLFSIHSFGDAEDAFGGEELGSEDPGCPMPFPGNAADKRVW